MRPAYPSTDSVTPRVGKVSKRMPPLLKPVLGIGQEIPGLIPSMWVHLRPDRRGGLPERKRQAEPILTGFGCLLVGFLTSQRQASVSQGRISSDNFTCCHTEIEVADPTFYLTQSQYTDNGPTSPSTDPITPDAWQGSHWRATFLVTGMTRPVKIPSQAGFKSRIFRSRGGRLNH